MISVLPIRCRTHGFLLVALVSVLMIGPATAQKQQPGLTLESISKPGPLKGELGNVATIDVPAGYLFVPRENMAKLNQLTGNTDSPSELGALFPTNGDAWWLVFAFNGEGYIKDDEKDTLDADAILKVRQEGQVEDNKRRKQRGSRALTLVGWEKAPGYDPATHNLTWGLKLSEEGQPGFTINHESRLLGRGGSMSAILIVSADNYAQSVPTYDKLLKGYSFTPGNTYSEYKPGDKIAEYGLMGLAAGGVLAVAAKSGLLGKLLKPIIAGIVILGGAIASFFRKIFGRGQASS